MSLKAGITGGIGSGKSTVVHIFEILGVPVLNADITAKYLMNNDPDLVKAIKELLGDEAYTGGELDRSFVASVVFSHPEKLIQLNQLVHPVTIAYSNNWAQQQSAPYIIKEAAIFFESGSYREMDKMIGVYTPAPLRLQRVMRRDNVPEEEVRKRMAQQMDEEEKMKRCDFVIINDERQAILPQVLSLHNRLLALAGN